MRFGEISAYLAVDAGEQEVPGEINPQAGVVGVFPAVLELDLHRQFPPLPPDDGRSIPAVGRRNSRSSSHGGR